MKQQRKELATKPSVPLSELITEEEAANLIRFISLHRKNHHSIVHNLTMKWLDKNPQVLRRFAAHGFIKPLGAYLLEFHLELDSQ